jgi:hypothetical protein
VPPTIFYKALFATGYFLILFQAAGGKLSDFKKKDL